MKMVNTIDTFLKKIFSKVLLGGVFLAIAFSLSVCSSEGSSRQGKSTDEYGSPVSSQNSEVGAEVKAENSKYELVVYKSPTCGCCDAWVEAMADLGYRLTVHSSDEQLWKMKNSLNMDPTLQSCHTTLVEGYILEGHVHPDSVARLLKERQKIRGLYLPGMIPNSVGMEQPGTSPVRYTILAVDYDKKKTIYDVYE